MNAFEILNSGISDASKKHGFRDASGNLLSKQGFFDLLAKSGINYVRTRVWVDPKDSSGNLYGGGNNDVTIAKEIATYVTNAGMKNLIDFHLSDLWTDPSKQRAPKAWKNMTIDDKTAAVRDHITSSLQTIESAGAVVSMVQVGNETNNGVAGETSWTNMDKIFDAGCDAVHAYETADNRNKGRILAAVHFADPNKGQYGNYAKNLADYDGDGNGEKEGVSYDIFASSYYPFFHGELSNLKAVLSQVASTYDKYVMVAETSYAHSLEDGDGFDNQIRVGQNDDDSTYAFTEQGQADEIRAVANAANEINVVLKNGDKASLGFFYWEPAWIPVQNISGLTGAERSAAHAKNKELWERVGAGWATSYAGEYGNDERDWYGGSSMDNQAVFDFDGNVMENINVFKYLLVGATGIPQINKYSVDSVNVTLGNEVELPSEVTLGYTDGSTKTVSAIWNTSDAAKINKDRIGVYTVTGYPEGAQDYEIQTTVTVEPVNLLLNPGFEEGNKVWACANTNVGSINNTSNKGGSNQRSGSYSYHFYSGSEFEDVISQTVKVKENGTYKAMIYGQGADASISVSLSSDKSSDESGEMALGGWMNWVIPSASIAVDDAGEEGKELTVKVTVKGKAGAWGAVDDAWLYLVPENETGNSASGGSSVTPSSSGDSSGADQASGNETPADEAPAKEDGAATTETKVTVDEETGDTKTETKTIEKDGTVIESEKTVSATGNIYEKSTETKPDGTVIETEKTTQANGAFVERTETTNADGSSEVVSLDQKKNGSYTKDTITTTVVTDSNGKTKTVVSIEKEVKTSKKTEATSYEVTGEGKKTVKLTKATFTAKKSTLSVPKKITADGVSYSVTSIASRAFKGNKKLTGLDIGSGVKTIGKGAFRDDSALKNISLNAKTIIKIGANAFKGINKKANIKIKGNKKQFDALVKKIRNSGAPKSATYVRVK